MIPGGLLPSLVRADSGFTVLNVHIGTVKSKNNLLRAGIYDNTILGRISTTISTDASKDASIYFIVLDDRDLF